MINGNVFLLKIFWECEWGFYVNMLGDVFFGLKVGFFFDKIVYSGSNLNFKEFVELFDWGIIIFNLDSVV